MEICVLGAEWGVWVEKLCNIQTTLKHVISQVYKLLTDLEGRGPLPFLGKWEQEMGIKLEDTQIERMIGAVHNYATDINTIEANYKYLVRWYLT